MKYFKVLPIAAVLSLSFTLAACGEKKTKIPTKSFNEEKGKSSVEFTGVVTRKTAYGTVPKTRVFCSYNPKFNHYSISLSEEGTKSNFHRANDGVFIEIFDNPSNVKTLKAKDINTSVTIVLKESSDAKNALFGRGDESCSITFDEKKKTNLKGKFDCSELTNEAGQKIAVKGSFECGSMYVWKF